MMKKLIALIKTLRPLNFLLLTLAGSVNAVGITFFLTPVKLYDSGISGTSMLLAQITPEWMTLSVFLLILNVPLFIFGYKKQGFPFTVYSVYTVAVYSVVAWLITDILPIDVSLASPLAGSDLLLCAIFGGVISGLGSGLAIRFGGAMDGIEVMAVIFSRKLGVSVGTFCMCYNVILYIICGFVINSWVLPLYSIVTYAAALKTVDYIIEGVDRSKALMIVTVEPESVCAMLSQAFEEGITIIDAKGYYSGSEKNLIYVVLNRFQISRAQELVHVADKNAYISIIDVADVFKSAHSQEAEKKLRLKAKKPKRVFERRKRRVRR